MSNGFPLGSSENPVLSSPEGAKAYLHQLRGRSGKPVSFYLSRRLWVRDGGAPHQLFVFCVTSDGVDLDVYFDPNHEDHREDRPLPGFTLEEGPGTGLSAGTRTRQ